jgi:hypothetical protein
MLIAKLPALFSIAPETPDVWCWPILLKNLLVETVKAH